MTMLFNALRTAPRTAAETAAAAAAASGTFTPVGSLPSPLFFASPSGSAVLLNSGKVLLAGGEDGLRNPQSAAVLFDPATGMWSPTGSMLLPRRLHGTTKLGDGRVLVTGGISGRQGPSQGESSAEIYDPATGVWTPAGTMDVPYFAHSATLMGNGRVLVAGGNSVAGAPLGMPFSSVYDPGTNQWFPAGTMTDARFGHSAVALHDGRVLVIGGAVAIGDGQYGSLGFCEIYDPATGSQGTWTPTGSMQTQRKNHQATVLTDGTVLVTGGDDPGVLQDWTYSPYSQFATERFNPATGAWTSVADMPWGRSHHRALLLQSGKVLVMGGTDSSTFDIGYQNATIYDPTADSWSGTIGAVTGRWAFAATQLADGRVLAAGGITLSGAATATVGVSVATTTSEVFAP